MQRKVVSGMMAILLLISISTLALSTRTVSAEPIDSDHDGLYDYVQMNIEPSIIDEIAFPNNPSAIYRSVYFANEVEDYEIAAYNDPFLYNAIRWVSFKDPAQQVICVVLDSWGSRAYGYWTRLADNYPDLTVLIRDGIVVTYQMLQSTGADVLIISDAWSRDDGWEFSDTEIQAIEEYISEKHGLIATAGSMDSDAPNNAKLGHLFGNEDSVQPWGYAIIDPWLYPDQRDVDVLYIDDPYHPTTVGLPPSYEHHHAACVWMHPIESHQVAHFDNYIDSIVTVYEHAVPSIPATIDIDPDTLNPKGKGQWITAYIELPEGYDVAAIDASTVSLNEAISPVLDPKYRFVTSSSEYLVDHDGDGIPERMVKFDATQVRASLSLGENTLTITGKADGMPFEGSDTIRVIDG